MLEWKIKEGMTDGEKGIKKRWDWREKERKEWEEWDTEEGILTAS